MPQKMQSILTSWRPRLSFRLKRFAARNGGDDSVEVVSEDEDEENLAATTRGSKRSAVASRELNNDYIVDSAPPKRHSPRTKSPFQAEPQLFMHPAAATSTAQKSSLQSPPFSSSSSSGLGGKRPANRLLETTINGGGNSSTTATDSETTTNGGVGGGYGGESGGSGNERKRAVRFFEAEFIPSPPKPPHHSAAAATSSAVRKSPVAPYFEGQQQQQLSPRARVELSRSPVQQHQQQNGTPPTPPAAAAASAYYYNNTASANNHQGGGGGKSVAMGGGGRLATIPESPTHNKLLLVNGGGDDYSAAARRVGIMGGNEFSQPPRPARNKNRANLLLQQLRTSCDDDQLGESDTNDSGGGGLANNYQQQQQQEQFRQPVMGSLASGQRVGGLSLATKGSVFLEYNNETKRSMLPVYLRSIEQIKSLFLRSFPNLTMGHLNRPNVKIYVQDPDSQRPIFYDLEDISDVKDQSVLKIHEQQAAPSAQSPAYSALHQQIPIRWTTTSKSPQSAPVSPPSVPPEYFSEPEFELNRASSRYNNWDSGAAYDGRLSLQQQQQPARPASVQPTHYLNHHQHQHQGHQQGINSNSNNRNYYGNSSSSRRERFPLPPEKQHNVGQGHGQGERAQRWMMSNGGQGESYNNCGEIHGQQNDSQQTAAMAYNSDSSSHYARSGSSTPVLDRNTWAKIDSIEQQLDKLATLVHSAFRQDNPNEQNQRREMTALRKQIMEVAGGSAGNNNGGREMTESSTSTLSNTSSLVGMMPSGYGGGGQHNHHKQQQQIYAIVQNQLRAIRSDVEQLRQQANDAICSNKASTTRALSTIREILGQSPQSIEKANAIFSSAAGQQQQQYSGSCGGGSGERRIEAMKQNYLDRLKGLQISLRSFEQNVEDIRDGVLSSNRKLRMREVEAFTNALTEIGKNSANLKMEVPTLQTELETAVQRYMENIVQEESFIKDRLPQVDVCLRRCKALANMMVTMKKLAMIQDPELYGSVAGDKQQQIAAEGGRQSVGIRQQQLNGRASALMKDLNDSAIAMGNGINGNGKWHQERRNNASTPVSSVSGGGVWREQQQLPTAEDSNNNNNCNGNDNAHVLDSILDELNDVAKNRGGSKEGTKLAAQYNNKRS